jgi:hypothetical protein
LPATGFSAGNAMAAVEAAIAMMAASTPVGPFLSPMTASPRAKTLN